jgi:hypothetical protein
MFMHCHPFGKRPLLPPTVRAVQADELAEYVGDRLCQYEHPAIVCGRERRRAPSRDRTPDL